MHDSDLVLPWFTLSWYIFPVFFVSLAVFHFGLIRYCKLGSIGWKRVDYWWLGMTFIGLLSSLSANRIMYAENVMSMAKARADSAFSQVRSFARTGSSPSVCRTFVRSEFSPPPEEFDRVQREFDDQCRWFKKLQTIIDAQASPGRIDPVGIAGPQPIGGDAWIYKEFTASLGQLENALEDVKRLDQQRRLEDFDLTLRFFGPWLIAVALALRITKVTGEIKIERDKDTGSSGKTE